MKTIIFFLFVWVLTNSTNTTYSIPISTDCSDKLSLSLQNLSQELQYFATPQQNKNNLYRRVAICKQYLNDLKAQMSQYNNVIIGGNNQVHGSKNIIVGSYNTIYGSNNFIFVEQFTGSANGDLLLEMYRIDLTKVELILVDPTMAISFLNQQQNRDYLTLMTKNRISSGYGSNINPTNIVTLIQIQDLQANSNAILNTQTQKSPVIYSNPSTPSTGSTSNTGIYLQNSQNIQSSTQTQTNNNQISNNGGYIQSIQTTPPVTTINEGIQTSNSVQNNQNIPYSSQTQTYNNQISNNGGYVQSIQTANGGNQASSTGGYVQNSQNVSSSLQMQNNNNQISNNGGYVQSIQTIPSVTTTNGGNQASNTEGYVQNSQNISSSSQYQNNNDILSNNGGYVQNIQPTSAVTPTYVQNQTSNTGSYSVQNSFNNTSFLRPNFNNFGSAPVVKSIAELNSLFGYNFGNGQMTIPTQVQLSNYNTGSGPGANVANEVISIVNQGNGSLNTYGNLRTNY